MKRTVVLTGLLVLTTLLLPLLSVTGSAEVDAPIFDNFSKAYTELGFAMGNYSNHGNNQTRIAYTSSGLYVTCPTDDFDSEFDPYANMNMVGANYVLYVIKPDGTKKILIQDKMFWTGAGSTTNVMVDKNEDIWVVTSWDEGSKHYPMIAWHYDVSEDKVTKYEEIGFAAKGGMYGKPYYIMDAENNKIYLVVFGWAAYGRVMWTTFDIETKTWDKTLKCQRAPCECCYHFGYPDGKGGFYFVTSRTMDNYNVMSDIEGLDVLAAMNKYQSRASFDVNQVWDETYLFYVPDPSTDTFYVYPFGSAVYDVEKGIYPVVKNRSSDAFLDKSTGLLYVLREEEDCGRIGLHMMLYIFDTNGRVGEPSDGNIFPLVTKTEVAFGYGVGVNYFPRMTTDLEGNLYIVVATERAGEIEIWRATDEIGSEYEYVCTVVVDEYYGDKAYNQWRSLIVANNRNNSMRSDTVYFLYECEHGWESFSIDFAALRAKYGL